MSSKKFYSVSKRIKLGYAFLILLFFLMTSTLVFTSLYFNSIYEKTITSIVRASRIQELVSQDVVSLKSLITNKDLEYEGARMFDEIENSLVFLQSVTDKNDKETLERIDSTERLINSYKEAADKIMKGIQSKDTGAAGEVGSNLESALKIKNFIDGQVKELIIKQLSYSQRVMDKIKLQSTIIIVVIAAFFISCVILSLTISIRLSKSISKGLNTLTKAASAIGEGDFSIKDITIDSNDEFLVLAGTFNTMKNNIKDISKRVVEAGYVISNVSAELKKGINVFFAANVDEIAAAREEQLSMHRKLLDTSARLEASAQELDGLIKNLKTSL